ncbi:MAG TPA: threonine ammonia-lyase [Planctomycetaceae bacterium]|jgi:threonine dehydratase|nr:threonine ammonia-lyase [Planctomycetaceae bacterium]
MGTPSSTLPVSYQDVLDAVPRVHGVLRPTPLFEWPGLGRLFGGRFLAKHENHQPVGAFKVRGGVNLAATLSDNERESGLLGCSTGNHGQSLAMAAKLAGITCTIVVPKGNNPGKNAAMRRLGATVIEHGADYDQARSYIERELAEDPARYVHSANEPALIAGVGTMGFEIFEDCPDPDVILVPIGLGSGVCGTGIVARARRPQTRVIGVQADGASAVSDTWHSGEWTTSETADTWAEGMATRVPAEMTLEIMREVVDDVLLVSDDDLRRACRTYLDQTHNLVEGAGAASLAAAVVHRDRFQGQTVVGIVSGGNLDPDELPTILASEAYS